MLAKDATVCYAAQSERALWPPFIVLAGQLATFLVIYLPSTKTARELSGQPQLGSRTAIFLYSLIAPPWRGLGWSIPIAVASALRTFLLLSGLRLPCKDKQRAWSCLCWFPLCLPCIWCRVSFQNENDHMRDPKHPRTFWRPWSDAWKSIMALRHYSRTYKWSRRAKCP